MRSHPGTADKPASREAKTPRADVATAVAVVMPTEAEAVGVEGAVEGMAGVPVGIEAAEKRADEEFQWRMK